MKSWPRPPYSLLSTVFLLIAAACGVRAAYLQLVSTIDSNLAPAAGGNGLSGLPVFAADSRFILFSSSADNLVVDTNGAAYPDMGLHVLNVFLRDRIAGATTFVSVNTSSICGGNSDSIALGLSGDARFALFQSSANDLVPGDTNNQSDVFLRDMVEGKTVLVSCTPDGLTGNGTSEDAVMTPDGRFVAFVSAATNLVAGDTNRITDVFVRDIELGVTTLVSVGAAPTNAMALYRSASEAPSISADGRYIAFYSSATNLVTGATKGGEVYVRDVVAGVTTWVSQEARQLFDSPSGMQSCGHKLSADGRYVAFGTIASINFGSDSLTRILRYGLGSGITEIIHTNAVVGTVNDDNSMALDMTPDGRFVAYIARLGSDPDETAIFRWDSLTTSNVLVSANLSDGISAGTSSLAPVISTNGQFIAFLSDAPDLVTNLISGEAEIYRRDVTAGVTELVTVDPIGSGTGVHGLTSPLISADGLAVVFEMDDGNLVPNDRNRNYDVFLRNLAQQSTELISSHHPELGSLTPNGYALSGFACSADGRQIVFASDADDIVHGDTNRFRDIFIRNLFTRSNSLASVGSDGGAAMGDSFEAALSGDGRFLAFTSRATNLVAGDANESSDVFVRDLENNTIAAVSVIPGGTGLGNADSGQPAISDDGRWVLFRSRATNLQTDALLAGERFFLRDMMNGETRLLAAGTAVSASMTPDGRYVAFVADPTAFTSRVYVWDSGTGSMVYTNQTPFPRFSLSPDGRYLAFVSSTGLTLVYLPSRMGLLVASGTQFPSEMGLRFNRDARWLVYSTGAALVPGDTNDTADVYLYDIAKKTHELVSRRLGAENSANDRSDSPDIDATGRYIVYRSLASDIVDHWTSENGEVYLYDRLNRSTTLLSLARRGPVPMNASSMKPQFSANGRTIAFQTWSRDLVDHDFNGTSDIVAFQFLEAGVNPGSGEGPTVTWRAIPGQEYEVEFKDDLNDDLWTPLPGTISIEGESASQRDDTVLSGHRFYRVLVR